MRINPVSIIGHYMYNNDSRKKENERKNKNQQKEKEKEKISFADILSKEIKK